MGAEAERNEAQFVTPTLAGCPVAGEVSVVIVGAAVYQVPELVRQAKKSRR
jgi:hypothetical protein